MSRENDLDMITRLLPQPPGVKLEDSRRALEKLSDGELSEIRADLVSISEGEPSPQWKATLDKVRDLSGLKPLLEEWDGHNKHIQDKGWLGAR